MSLGASAFVVVWVSVALGFGLWMLLWPKDYWKTWESYLQRSDSNESLFPGRTEFLRNYVHRPNADRRARILGAFLVVIGLVAAALFAFGTLPPK